MKMETIGENADYIESDSLAALEVLDDSAWPVLCEAASALDTKEPGIDTEIAITRETLEDFDNSRKSYWREKGEREEIEVSGIAGRVYREIQICKGERRRSLIVLDFGEQRATMIKW